VLAAPAAAGVVFQPEVIAGALVAFTAFCLAASGSYYLNDAMDVEADRLHPRKRHRPVASGLIPVPVALAVAVVLLVASIGVAALTGRSALVGAIFVYVLLTISYSLWLKHLPVIDIMVVAAGFIIRAAAGGFATGVELSDWFLIVASFGALFIVVGKRHAEIEALGGGGGAHRAVLEAYAPEFTRHVLAVASGITMIAYCLWAFEAGADMVSGLWHTFSIVPFVAVLLRYSMLVHGGEGGEPEEILLKDRGLQIMGLVWIALLAAAIRLG
jgi:decaprenyl-phosphate phosphoribosyltransferase